MARASRLQKISGSELFSGDGQFFLRLRCRPVAWHRGSPGSLRLAPLGLEGWGRWEKGTRPTLFPAPSTMSAQWMALSVIRALKFARQIPLNFRSTSSTITLSTPKTLTARPQRCHPPPQLNFLAAVAPRFYITTCTVSTCDRTRDTSRWPPNPLRASHRLALPICPTSGTKSSPRGVLLSLSWSDCPSRARPLVALF